MGVWGISQTSGPAGAVRRLLLGGVLVATLATGPSAFAGPPRTPAGGTASAVDAVSAGTPGATSDTAPAGNVAAAPGAVTAPRTFRGSAFDTCTAPPLSTLRAWRSTTGYRALGVYVGGRARACRQPELTRSWVAGADRAGWRLLPLYVGSQPPCVTAHNKRAYPISTRNPRGQARSEAADAVRKARALGIAPGSPLYLDMEHYDIRNTRCVRTVLAFTTEWSRRVRGSGYLAGFYSSAESGIRSLADARRRGTANLPDVVWFARWNGKRTLHEPVLRKSDWHPHRRVHQYRGEVRERHGGRTLLIDRNLVDAPVAVVSR